MTYLNGKDIRPGMLIRTPHGVSKVTEVDPVKFKGSNLIEVKFETVGRQLIKPGQTVEVEVQS